MNSPEKRPLDSYFLDAYVGLTAGWITEFLSGSRLDQRLAMLLLPIAVLSAAGFLRSARPAAPVRTTIFVSAFAVIAPLMLIKTQDVPARAAIVFAAAMVAGTSLGVWVRSLVCRRLWLRALTAECVALTVSVAVVFGPGTRIVDRLDHPLVNRPLPAVALETFSGTPIDRENWQGRVVVLDFWATWCGPCKLELPVLSEVQRQYKNDPRVIVLAVDTGSGFFDKKEDAVAYLKSHEPGLNGALWNADEKAFRGLLEGVDRNAGVPLLLIIGKNGRVRFQYTGFDTRGHFRAEITNTVDDLLRE